MKITIEAETDEEREHYPEPLPITGVHLFAMSGATRLYLKVEVELN